jgi:hypothetical protein
MAAFHVSPFLSLPSGAAFKIPAMVLKYLIDTPSGITLIVPSGSMFPTAKPPTPVSADPF